MGPPPGPNLLLAELVSADVNAAALESLSEDTWSQANPVLAGVPDAPTIYANNLSDMSAKATGPESPAANLALPEKAGRLAVHTALLGSILPLTDRLLTNLLTPFPAGTTDPLLKPGRTESTAALHQRPDIIPPRLTPRDSSGFEDPDTPPGNAPPLASLPLPEAAGLLDDALSFGRAALERTVHALAEAESTTTSRNPAPLYWVGLGSWLLGAAVACVMARRHRPRPSLALPGAGLLDEPPLPPEELT